MHKGSAQRLAIAGMLLGLTSLSLQLCAQVPDDVADRVNKAGESARKSAGLIDIGKTIFGHPFGESEKTFMEKEGKPDGYFSLGNGRTVLVYGRKTGFIFDDGKLNGIRITHGIFDWTLSEQIARVSRFDRLSWHTARGLRENLSEKCLRDLYGKELLKQGHYYHYLYKKDGYLLQIDLSTTINQDGSEGQKNVSSILLTKE